jgi:5-methylcytosine-specific restriction endonuclease McrA
MSDHLHESVLEKQLTLVLNRSWLTIGFTSPKKAIVSLMGGDQSHPVMALDIAFDEDGNLAYANPVEWETWVNLPIREQDLYVQTHKGRIRVPTVIVARNFNKIPMRKPRLSSSSIFERDGGRCQYTDKILTRSSASMDHVLPRSRGGRDSWQNLVLCDKHVNLAKADRTPEEAGLILKRKPIAPPEVPVSTTIRNANHVDWTPFLMKG